MNNDKITIDPNWSALDVDTVTMGCEVLVSASPIPTTIDQETGLPIKGKGKNVKLGIVSKIIDDKITLVLIGTEPIKSRIKTLTSDHILCVTKTLKDRVRLTSK